jgi:hypothetical protein
LLPSTSRTQSSTCDTLPRLRRGVDQAVEALHWFDINHPGKVDEEPKVALDASKIKESEKKADKAGKIAPVGSGQDLEAASNPEDEKPKPTTEQRKIRQLIETLKQGKSKGKKLWTFTWKDLHELATSKGMDFDPKNFRETVNRMGKKGDGLKVSQEGKGRRPTTYFPNLETSEVD